MRTFLQFRTYLHGHILSFNHIVRINILFIQDSLKVFISNNIFTGGLSWSCHVFDWVGEPHRCEALICSDQPATAEMLYGASGELVGMGSSLPSASALARTYIWLEVAPAASIALATTSQLRISVDIWDWIKDETTIASQLTCPWRWNPPMDRTCEMRRFLLALHRYHRL